MEKKFKPFDRVIIRLGNKIWKADLYSHYGEIPGLHKVVSGYQVGNNDILPYEGNEELVGTTDEPETEVRLEEGEIIIAIYKEDYECGFSDGVIGTAVKFKNKFIERNGKWGFSIPGGGRNFAIRFSDFNPNDMEATKGKILCVKNGKVVKYSNNQ